MQYYGASMSRRLVRSSVNQGRANIVPRFRLRNHVLGFSMVLMSSVASMTSSSVFADTVALQANLQPSSEVPPRVSKGHGVLKASFDTTTKTLQWTVTYADLSGPATMAH